MFFPGSNDASLPQQENMRKGGHDFFKVVSDENQGRRPSGSAKIL